MQKSDKLLGFIEGLDALVVELKIDGATTFAERIAVSIEELYWVFKDLSEYE